MTTWQEWAVGVLAGIKAPRTPTNIATLKGWSTREKGDWPSVQWCNPLNSTEPWPGAVDSGAQPGAHDMKIYPTVAAGVGATIKTLIGEPFYPAIVANLRASLPASWWVGDARSQLDTWGTGQSWFDVVPLTEDVMSQLDDIQTRVRETLDRVRHVASLPTDPRPVTPPYAQQIGPKLDQLVAASGGGGTPADLTALTTAVASLTTKVDAMEATLTKIENALKGA
jgi:hypothetical protein